MRNFPIMSMRKGDDVTVTTGAGVARGTVETWTNEPGEGFAVLVKLQGEHQWFYVRQGAQFWR